MVGRWKISSPRRPDAWSRKDGIALGGVLLVVAGLALALAWPWLPRPAPGGPTLARYAPIRDGEATLLARYDAGDELQGWESRNAAFVPAAAIYNDLRGAFASAILQFYRRPGEASFPIAELTTRLAPVQIRESRSRELPVRGHAKSSSDVLLREARGELLVGHYDAATHRETLFDPPVLLLPADLDVGREWTSEGTLGGADAYAVRGQVLEAGRSGPFDDCLRVRLQIAFTVDGMTGDTLFVGASSPGRGGVVVALDMADGRPRWQSELGLGSLHFAERLWSDGETVVPISSGVVLGLDAVSRFTGEIGLGG